MRAVIEILEVEAKIVGLNHAVDELTFVYDATVVCQKLSEISLQLHDATQAIIDQYKVHKSTRELNDMRKSLIGQVVVR